MARLEVVGGEAAVELSRRGLAVLLGGLDRPESARTLVARICWRDGEPLSDLVLVLCDDQDTDRHERNRPAPPGPVAPA